MESTINTRFKQLLQEAGVTAADLSRIFDLKIQGVYKYLNGESIPRVELLEKLLGEFPQLSMEYLIRGQGPMLVGLEVGRFVLPSEGERERLAALEREVVTLRDMVAV